MNFFVGSTSNVNFCLKVMFKVLIKVKNKWICTSFSQETPSQVFLWARKVYSAQSNICDGASWSVLKTLY